MIARHSLPQMLFTRTYHGFLGGHLKVFDYMRHVALSGTFEPVLYLTPESTQMPPPELLPDEALVVREPFDADAFFVAGLNWRILDDAAVRLDGKPVVNLIQGLRHGLPGDPRRAFLPRRALRICVSTAIESTLRETGEANGPIVTVPNAVDAAYLAQYACTAKERRVFIAGAKNPQAARALGTALASRGMPVDTACELVPRGEFLERMSRCSIAVLLPHPREGFFLPALEAMMLQTVCVLPYCEGASDFCIDGATCVHAAYDAGALCDAVFEIDRDPDLAARLRRQAAARAQTHTLERERELFLTVLHSRLEEAA